MTDNEPEDHWTIDRRVPLALIITILIQCGVFIWWIAGLSGRVDNLERSELARSGQSDRLTKLETKLDFIQESLQRIERATVSPPPRP